MPRDSRQLAEIVWLEQLGHLHCPVLVQADACHMFHVKSGSPLVQFAAELLMHFCSLSNILVRDEAMNSKEAHSI